MGLLNMYLFEHQCKEEEMRNVWNEETSGRKEGAARLRMNLAIEIASPSV